MHYSVSMNSCNVEFILSTVPYIFSPTAIILQVFVWRCIEYFCPRAKLQYHVSVACSWGLPQHKRMTAGIMNGGHLKAFQKSFSYSGKMRTGYLCHFILYVFGLVAQLMGQWPIYITAFLRYYPNKPSNNYGMQAYVLCAHQL